MQGHCDGEGRWTEANADEVVRLGVRSRGRLVGCAGGLDILVEGKVGGAIDLMCIVAIHRDDRYGGKDDQTWLRNTIFNSYGDLILSM